MWPKALTWATSPTFFGKHLQEVYAPETGVILLILGTPPVNAGESILGIGIVKQ